MMAQYRGIKERFADSILFFRLGDFYEMFDKDARRGLLPAGPHPHAEGGGPHVRRSLPRRGLLHFAPPVRGQKGGDLRAGTPARARGLMSRDVLEVITPGTVLDDGLLSSGGQQLSACHGEGRENHCHWPTRMFPRASSRPLRFPWRSREQVLKRELHRLEPREVITQESLLVEDAVPAGPPGRKGRPPGQPPS